MTEVLVYDSLELLVSFNFYLSLDIDVVGMIQLHWMQQFEVHGRGADPGLAPASEYYIHNRKLNEDNDLPAFILQLVPPSQVVGQPVKWNAFSEDSQD